LFSGKVGVIILFIHSFWENRTKEAKDNSFAVRLDPGCAIAK